SGYIYAGTANNSDGAQIWRSNDDTTWTKVAQYPLYASITSIKDIGGTLWVTASPNGTLGGQILKSTTDTSFVISNGNGFGESGITGNLASTLQFGNNIYWAGENYAMPLIAPHGGSRGGTVVGQGAEVWRLCTVAPSVISAGADQTICSGLNATFTATAGFTNYVWDRDTLSVSQMLITNIQGSHQVTAVDVNGCDASDTVNLNTIPSPGSGVTNPYPLAPAYVCKGNTINFTTSNYSNVRTTLPEMSSTDSLFIYDGGTVLDSIVVAGVNDDGIYNTLVNVTIDSLYHTEDGDLSLVLIAPNGSYMTLSSYSGYGSQNYIGTVFSPSASTYIGSGTGPFTGTYSTYDPFYYLNGPTNGTWKLQVYDGINLNQGSLKGWSLNFSQPDTNMTYAWSPATGLSSVNTANTIATGVSTTTYSLTVTNSIGCSTTDTILLHVPQVQITPPTAVVCFGSSTSLTATGGSNYYWSPATALSATTGSVVTTTASSNITYYVTDTTAGCASIDSVNVSANPALSAVAGPDQSACYADTVHLSASGSGGSPGYTYVWNYSTGSYPTQNASVVGLTTGTATLTVTDAAGCTAENALNITVIPSTDIYGHVGYSLGNVTNGKAVIYPYRPFYTHFDTLQVQSLDAAGNYHFTSINHGDYLIKVFADTTAYPTLDPTYFGNTWAWDSATVMMHGCGSSDTANITMIEELGPGGGPGFLRGQITEGLGFGHSHAPTDPIPGVDVHLGRNPGGSAMISTTTDATGYYYFTNVALNAPGQRYTVYVDIPGLARDSSYSVVLDAAHTSYVYLDYYVDSTTIYILPNAGAGISNPDMAKENKFNVYPNPFRGNSTIEYSIPADADVKLDVYNILGTRINTLTSGKQQAGDYKYTLNNLNTGVYFVTLSVNKNVTTQRVIVIE
ncbi:MAG: T9SS type A sorting domain-containing protein, partial [Bacteroidia bacterium]